MRCAAIAAIFLLAASSGAAQDPAARTDRLGAPQDGTVRLTYTTRPNVCGDGEHISWTRADGSTTYTDRYRGGRRVCRYGPARLQVTAERGTIIAAKLRVGGDWPAASGRVTDLGRIDARQAAAMLLDWARLAEGNAGGDLVFSAVIADSAELRDPLHRLARNSDAPRKVRTAAVFWLGEGTESDVTGLLEGLARDGSLPREIQKTAVFALAQQDPATAVPALVRIIRSDRPTEIRAEAVFWLGQSDSERSVAFLTDAYRDLDNKELKDKIIFAVSQSDDPAALRWLVDVARDRREPVDLRKQAIFWAGQRHASGADLVALYDGLPDRVLKEQLIFVYSQGKDEAMLDKLFAIARDEPDHDLRKNAVFWIGQSDSPRARRMLEDIIAN